LKKRTIELRGFPDPSNFSDWKDWARQQIYETSRQLEAASMVLPFFEFGLVKRDNDYTPTGAAIPWESVIYDNSNSIWTVAQATRLVVPPRAGAIKYGYGTLLVNLAYTDPGGANNLTARIRKNGVITAPSAFVARSVIAGLAPALQISQPWGEVNAGDYFEVLVSRTGAGTAVIDAGTDTWAMLMLGGPA
jgi:hypothetical protein